MKQRKLIALLLCALMTAAVFTGCGGKKEAEKATSKETAALRNLYAALAEINPEYAKKNNNNRAKNGI